jgi:hypothetical protein
MHQTFQPSREQFAAYWKDYGKASCRDLIPHAVYLAGLGAYALLVRHLDPEAKLLFLSFVGAGVYLVALPYLWIRRIHKRSAEFIRCPDCGDWFGQDSSGAYHGPNPKFRVVLQTGRCSKCGKQILADV